MAQLIYNISCYTTAMLDQAGDPNFEFTSTQIPRTGEWIIENRILYQVLRVGWVLKDNKVEISLLVEERNYEKVLQLSIENPIGEA